MYYGNPKQLRRMRHFYSEFIRPGDLVFDIGAHVGSRTMVWSRMGARVVAVEPVPQAVRTLRVLFGRSRRVKVVPAAVGAEPGSLPMLVSEREPTVSTLSPAWADRMRSERKAFASTRWERSITVPVLTLDQLIADYGEPAFCKIDTEGYDLQVLRGLSHPLRALSFEYVPPAVDLVRACVQRLSELRPYAYNWSVGESMQLHWPTWVDATTLTDHLDRFPSQGNPGDIYARATD
jgi:FkbM family methyltransferase